MATKNLARTIIEGGCDSYNKFQRRYSHKEERALTRAYLSRAGRREEGFEGAYIGKRPKVYKGFDDKLGAPRRWLRSQVGRPWDKVRSEIFTRFNPRSLAGQHIIFDHLLTEVRFHEVESWRSWRHDLYVDKRGILRSPERQRRVLGPSRAAPALVNQALNWADGRRVACRATALYWSAYAGTCDFCVLQARSPCCCPVGPNGVVHGSHHHYRQQQRLTSEEEAFWNSLGESTQKLLVYISAASAHEVDA